jgi:hypothetical protein
MSLDGPPEVHPPHDHKPHGGGLGRPPAWLEWFTSIAALVVSVSSIAIALHHGDTMDKLVKANSFPYLVGVTSDATPDGHDQISVDFYNNGVGPADEQSLTIKLGDRYVTSVPDLISTTLGPDDAKAATPVLRSMRNTIHSRFIAPKGDQFVFRIPKTPENAAWWDRLDKATDSWRITYCYCSVFNECWRVEKETHTPVAACKRDEAHEFTP